MLNRVPLAVARLSSPRRLIFVRRNHVMASINDAVASGPVEASDSGVLPV